MRPTNIQPELAQPNGDVRHQVGRDGMVERLSAAFERAEGLTWLVIFAVYGGILALLSATEWMPIWIVCPALVVLGAWHSHMQHELLHGHPTSLTWLNDAIASVPVTLLYPYSVYKRSHMDHHLADLANPLDDPESYYVMPETWDRTGTLYRTVLIARNSVVGRFLIGPILAAFALYREQLALIVRGDRQAWLDWSVHATLVAVYLWAVQLISGIPPWLYVVAVAYPGVGLMMVRSFLEHRPAENPDHRTAIVEGNWFWSLLFLNNNLHVVHHDYPGEPWYRLQRIYAEQRDVVLQRNGGYLYEGYGEVFRRHLFSPKDTPVFKAEG